MEENLIASKLIVIGGSAGSLQIILYILRHLQIDFAVPMVIVMHRSADNESTLVDVLSNACKLKVKEAEDKESILPGKIYVAPADYHLLIEKNRSFSLDGSEKVQFSRPSIDVTFQSAADAYGALLLGILLSGANNDGADGFADIRRAGGALIVQDPQNAIATAMPQSAINKGLADYILDAEGIVDRINLWT
ncbi:chemotaxis protein CheB [Mucilaginibacter gotjawali]|uniref:Two-component system chemotaxis response regulator CheB n=2 Tax=Mucilaginibacter gotjawali TaxID=1550579 RepID=A0A839SMV1_9SPHI|nr:chemotaxis protein CheB [Mucilaginibacter gotjawali]MBB3058170.1 two-component system chemotaxis response regulator CheB [Mucilaginibacter gotjawali]BAU54875.1 Chemotaxis response regulator protein-glutamate methylesterase [Mucilaginibacter gotjawali]